MKINGHLDLFSGIGGFSLALEKVGVQPNWVGFSDIDKYANELFQRRFKDAKKLGNITDVRCEDLPKNIDLLTGGFPCQPFSIAGSRLAFEDTRGTLFYEIVRILKFYIQEERAIEHFVLENVKGLYSAGARTVFPAIYKILTDIGYSVECELLNSKHFGVPQNRERIYFVGRYIGNGGRPKVFPVRENDKKIKVKKIEIIGHSGSGGQKGVIHSVNEISGCLSATDYKQPKQIAVADYRNDEGLRIRKEFISPCLPARRTSETDPSTMPPLLVEQIGGDNKSNKGTQPYQQDRVYDSKGLSPALSEGKSDLIIKSGALRTREKEDGIKKRLEKRKDNVSNAVTTHNLDSIIVTNPYNGKASSTETGTLRTSCGTSTGKTAQLVVTNKIRRLTPIECERLQGFPDNWTDGQSDTQRYKQCGNAITVNVAEYVFRKLYNK